MSASALVLLGGQCATAQSSKAKHMPGPPRANEAGKNSMADQILVTNPTSPDTLQFCPLGGIDSKSVPEHTKRNGSILDLFVPLPTGSYICKA